VVSCDGVNGPAPLGSIQVVTSATGADLDSDGYTCHLDGGARSQSIGINETEVMTDPATGEHSAELSEARG